MLENAMIMHNGYGIRDSQEYEPIPVEDEMGSELLTGDEILVAPNGNVILRENAADYLMEILGFTPRKVGE